jgi:predicted AAA+ superfamily ATPase
MKYIERELSKKFKKAVQSFPVVCLTGPRQTGKSTMLF